MKAEPNRHWEAIRCRRAVVVCGATVALSALVTGAAHADSCGKSRDILLESGADLPQKPQVYRELFKICLEALQLSNVKDAFVLKVGAVAVIPRNDGLAATAGTLAQFCTRFPTNTLHFIGRKEQKQAASISRVVQMEFMRSTSCQKIMGNG